MNERSPKKPDDWVLPKRYGDPEYPRHPETGKLICASYSHRLNKFGDPVCIKPPKEGMARCKQHGGSTPVGLASPHYEGKGYSRILDRLPKRNQDDYAAAQLDEQMNGLSNEMALLDARLMELLGKLDVDGTKTVWEELRDASEMLEMARGAGDASEIAFQVNRIQVLIKADVPGQEYRRWAEVYNVVERKRRLADTIRKIRRDENEFISREQQMMFVHALAGVIRDNVKDPESLNAISRGMARLITGGSAATQPVRRVISGVRKPLDAND